MPYHIGSYQTLYPIQKICLFCGSDKVSLGCQFQDCEKCNDIESSSCLKCGATWGGASYWKPLQSFRAVDPNYYPKSNYNTNIMNRNCEFRWPANLAMKVSREDRVKLRELSKKLDEEN